ncbi:MAG: hypothetical protein F9K18_04145 [Thermoanaerobaculia bacterium]|nr:MAG: hypothetical protein F9K18_04145 [Thermoanaerobaculia bacterium]
MPAVVLLGPQRFVRTLSEAAARAGIAGRFASVTAGWQERESEDLELHEHLSERTLNLRLYARAEDAFERDPVLARAHRERQERLREVQGLYRIRLGHAQAALRELSGREAAADLLAGEKAAALEAIRELDARHVEHVAAVHRAFEESLRPRARPAVARHVAALEREVGRSEAVLVAGGHVPVLLNRLRLFGFPELASGRPVCAWSGGAMAMTERVVLFHHSPPQGFGNTEVLEAGLGLVRGLVAFPHARRRLLLDDTRRMELLARRFAPAECLTLDDGAWLIDRAGAREAGPGLARLGTDGQVAPLARA